MEKVTTEEFTNKLDMFQSIFGKIDEFGWWYLEGISEDSGKQFNSTKFKGECQTCGVHLALAAPEHQEMNVQVKVTWRSLHTIEHSFMVHARVLEAYIYFALMYTIDHVFPVLPIKDLIKEDGNPTTPFKFATGTKPSVSHLRVLFCPCVVRKTTAHVEKKGVKYVSPSAKGFSRYLRQNSTASKRIDFVRNEYK